MQASPHYRLFSLDTFMFGLPNRQRSATGAMKLEDWLKSYITAAFARVTLEDGVDIHTAKVRDSYGFDQDESQRAVSCQRGDWRFVDPQLLRDRAWVLTFLDTKGFRFYLPVIMIDIIDDERKSDLSETLFYKFSVTHHGRFMDQRYDDVFNRSQRAAIIRFLKYLCYNRNWQLTGPAGKLLSRLTQR
jgi:hypothetical protein